MLAAIPYKTFPEIDLGPVTLHTFGLLVGLGVLAGVYLLAVLNTGLDRDTTYRFGFWVVVLGFVGARLTYVITNFDDLGSPLDAIAVWKGGLQFTGGFILGLAYAVWWLRAHPDVDRWHLLDSLSVALAAGLAIGRVGCYSVGEHLGGRTSFFLGTKYLGGVTRENAPLNGGPLFLEGDVIHNTALYEFLHLAVLVGLLLLMRQKVRLPGALFAVFLGWYGTARFLTDFLRAYDRTRLGLTGAQWFMLVVLAGAVFVSHRILTRSEPPMEQPEVPQAVILGADWD